MYIWPRQEVLQLVLMQISKHGKPLTKETIFSVVKKLSKQQTPEGLVVYVIS